MSFRNHFSIKHIPSVRDSCASLYEHTEMTCFAFDITFPNGNFVMLSDQKSFIEPFYYQDLLPSCTDRFGRALPEGVYTHAILKHIDPEQSARIETFLNPTLKTTQFVLIAQNYVGYQTLSGFGFNMREADFDFFVLNHSETLKKFLTQFQENNRALIAQATRPENRVYIPALATLEIDRSVYSRLSKKSPLISAQAQFSSQVAFQGISLPKQQEKCLQKTFQGLSIKKIADEMGLSTRTVEAYLAIVREKLSCRSTRELVANYGPNAKIISKL